MSSDPVALEPGTLIGSYEIVRPLGKGGMGIVFEALSRINQAPVALKTVRTANPYLLSSIRREILRLRRLSHPGVVRILDDGTFGGLPYYAMELLQGRTLEHEIELRSDSGPSSLRSSERASAITQPSTPTSAPSPQSSDRDTSLAGIDLATVDGMGSPASPNVPILVKGARGPLSAQAIPEFLDAIQKLCDALVYIHGEGVVHRDIKPSNVFLREGGQPVLVDFGLVVAYTGIDGREVLQVDSTMGGTIAYMAPEQLHGDLVDARADLFALGCILYEALTGQLPFSASIQTRLRENFAPPPLPSLLSPVVEPWLDRLVLQLIAADRRERIGHASDVIAALSQHIKKRRVHPQALSSTARSYLYRPSFAGRRELLTFLTSRARELTQGTGELILLSGESGSGKTRLLSELVRHSTLAKIGVIASDCPPLDVTSDASRLVHQGPLFPLRPCLLQLADLCRTHGVQSFRGLSARHLAVLSAIEPALGELAEVIALPDAKPLAVDAVKHQVLSAAVEAIIALSSRAPLLLLFDDLQWADELTLELLSYLAQEVVEHAHLLIVGGFRSEETTSSLQALLQTAKVRHIPLTKLDNDAIGSLIADMLAVPEPPAELVQFVAEHAAGNPFFVSEYLHTVVDEGLLRRNRFGEWALGESPDASPTPAPWAARLQRLALPRTLRAVVERRLRRLSPELSEILAIAALLGREFQPELLGELCTQTEAVLAESINDAIRRQLLEPSDGGRYRFAHDKLREVAYDTLSVDRRRTLHHAAAQAMERRGVRITELSEVANHFSKAEIPNKAIEYLRRAAEHALTTGAHKQAVPLLVRAFEHATDPRSAITATARAKLHRLYADALFGIGDSDGSVVHAEAALTALDVHLPKTPLRWMLMLLAQCGEQFVRINSKQATQADPVDEDRLLELAQAAGRLSSSYFAAHQPQLQVMTATLLAANLADRAGPQGACALPYSILGCTTGFFRMERLSKLYFARARQDAQRRDARGDEAVIAIQESALYQGMARWPELVSVSESAARIAQQVDDRLALGALQLIRGGSELLTGELHLAERRLGEIVRDAEGRGSLLNHGWAASLLGLLALWKKRPREARELGRTARKDFSRDRGSAVANALAVEAMANLLLADRKEALALAEEGLVALARGPVLFQMWPACELLCAVLLPLWQDALTQHADNEPRLRSAALRACRAARSLGNICPIGQPISLRAWGTVANILGQSRRAHKRLEEAVVHAERLKMPLELAQSCLALGRALPDDPERRAHLLQRAHHVSTELGCSLFAEQATALLTETPSSPTQRKP